MKRVVVSDHALLRYIERVHGVDIEYLRDIVREAVEDAARVGASKFSNDGFTYVFEQYPNEAVLKTVLPAPSPGAGARWREKATRDGAPL